MRTRPRQAAGGRSRGDRTKRGDQVFRPYEGPQTQFLSSPAYELGVGGSAGGGKRLRVDEPVPTPSGWTTMGALRPGDVVFDADGRPTRVTWCSPIELAEDVWELEFDDGTTIQADAEHLWVTMTYQERLRRLKQSDEWRARRRAKRPSRATGRATERFVTSLTKRNAERVGPRLELTPPRGRVRTTQQIVDTLLVEKGRKNHAILNAGALDLPEADLPIDPYVLGAWLGDGCSYGGSITAADHEVLEAIREAGFELTKWKAKYGWNIQGLTTKLRALGLIRNKHVPQSYLRGSRAQRIALLQGLCDTDGYACQGGDIEFTTTNECLRDGMLELLSSLGVKPSVTHGVATLYGRAIGPKWRIRFHATFAAFRIARKLSRQKRDGFRGTQAMRYVVAARRAPPTLMRCIAVEAESRTYLAGRRMVPTHNSFALLLELACEIDNPEYAAIAFRRTFPELKSTLIEESKRIYPGLGGVYHETDHLWRFPSGARIYLGHLQHEGDVQKYRGPEFGRIVFDELTTFSESQYRFMFSRLRRRDGRPCYMRFGTNPGGVGHDFVLRRFAPWLYPKGHDEYEGPITEPGTKVRERLGERPHAASGEILWVRSTDEGHELICDRFTHDPGCAKCAVGIPCVRHRPVSRSFIHARISDNPTYAGTEYEARLYQLDPLTRAQMLDGDWLARPAAGLFFKRHWFKALPVAPADIVVRVRYWDRAASEVTAQNTDPDWTVGVLLAVTSDRRFIVEDVVRVRESPAKVEATIATQAALDPPGTIVGLELDPAAAGKFEAMSYLRLLAGHAVTCVPPWGDKITRAKPVSSQAEAGNFYVLPGSWNRAYLQTMENFGEPNVHDDDVDATSGAFRLAVLEFERAAKAKRRNRPAVRSFGHEDEADDDD